MSLDRFRNFCIIAHVDHGKSTLADRLIQACSGVDQRHFQNQLLDSMDLERERGITIKASAVHLGYVLDDKPYVLNLIDTPGHVDFSYEVARSLAACEGAILVVDATQGVEAQTVANVYQALDRDLELVPVINKIDLPSARPEETKAEIHKVFGIKPDEMILASAKEGIGIGEILRAVIADKNAVLAWGEGFCEGRIMEAPRGSAGFGYDPWFLSADLGKTFAEAALCEKHRVSHRARALQTLRGSFAELYRKPGTRGAESFY